MDDDRDLAGALRDADLGRRKLEAVLAALPVGVWIADADGTLTHSNPAAERIWGGRAPHTTASEYGVYKGFSPASGARLRAEDWALARTFATGETITAEPVDIERFDGTRGHILISTAPIRDARAEIIGGVVVILDASDARAVALDRERLIASLDFERTRLGTLLEKAPAFMAVTRGADHVFELANEAYYALVGRRELIGRSVTDAIPEIRGQSFVEMLDRVLATGEPFTAKNAPVMLARRPGEPLEQRYLDVMCQPLAEADGTRSGVFAHGVDVTEAAVAQQKLRAQFHGVPVPTYVWQRLPRDGARPFVLVDFNQAAITLSRGRIADCLGETAAVYFADDPSLADDLDRCLDQGVTIQRELDRYLKTIGETRRLYVTYASAEPDMVIVHTEDITERSRLEAQLRQSQKMDAVGRLAGGIAHDFNNILSVILSYTEMSLDELKPTDPRRDDIGEIHKAAKRAVGLTRQLLAFSRQQILQPRMVDLDQTVRGFESMLRRLLGEDIELVLRSASKVREVFADPGQLEQVIMNLAVNARDAMPTGGTLTIETANVDTDGDGAAGAFVMLAVTDTGTGMTEVTRARVFEPFFTTKDTGKGTGLGLSMVFGIVHQSGGKITVESAVGRGSSFKSYLPRAQSPVESSTLTPIHGIPMIGSETILLVEDDDAVRRLARAILHRSGYVVLDAQNGGEAFLVSEQHATKIDLLLTDVVMPRMSGRIVAERLLLARPDLKVLYMSGYTDDATMRHGVLESGVAFIQKPITAETLLRAVRDVLDSETGGRAIREHPVTA